MSEIYRAVFTKGTFHLLNPANISLSEGQEVKIVVEPLSKPDDMLNLLASVYDGLTDREVDEIEAIALDRQHFFHDRSKDR